MVNHMPTKKPSWSYSATFDDAFTAKMDYCIQKLGLDNYTALIRHLVNDEYDRLSAPKPIPHAP
jgi:hypothetical protein